MVICDGQYANAAWSVQYSFDPSFFKEALWLGISEVPLSIPPACFYGNIGINEELNWYWKEELVISRRNYNQVK